MKIISKKIILGILLTTSSLGNLIAQESNTNEPTKNNWTFLVEPYILFPNMNGTVGLGELPNAEVDANTNNIFNNLKMGFMLNAEASNDKWTVGSDVLYMSLGEEKKLSRELINGEELTVSGEITAKQTGWELMGLRRVTPWLELGLGGLINSINTEVKLTTPEIGGETTTRRKSITETWLDPMIIARIKSKAGEKFVYQFRGEFGGFGIGSDFAWQIQAYAGYKFSKLFEVTGGYRVIGLDFKSGSGKDRFLYDVDTSGPMIRFGFRF